MNIKGEYEIKIQLSTMFNNHIFQTKQHNIVTEKGLNLLLGNALKTNDEFLGDIRVGTDSTEPTLQDTSAMYPMQKTIGQGTEPQIIDNTILYDINTDGSYLDLTTEIGIFSTKGELLTRDVHDTYDIPHSAIINLKYTLTITNINNEEIEEEEEDTILND